MREMGRAGGRRRTETLSVEQRRAIARTASLARWRRARSVPASITSADGFAQSLRWLSSHRKRYAGKWVALAGDRLIASGSSALEVYQAARSAGVTIPFVEQVRPMEELPFGGW